MCACICVYPHQHRSHLRPGTHTHDHTLHYTTHGYHRMVVIIDDHGLFAKCAIVIGRRATSMQISGFSFVCTCDILYYSIWIVHKDLCVFFVVVLYCTNTHLNPPCAGTHAHSLATAIIREYSIIIILERCARDRSTGALYIHGGRDWLLYAVQHAQVFYLCVLVSVCMCVCLVLCSSESGFNNT